MAQELYIGVMSGTSADGIDVILADIRDTGINLVGSISADYHEQQRQDIKNLSSPGEDEINQATMLGISLSETTAALINKLLKQTKIAAADILAIGYHGQTIRHHPSAKYPFSVQIGCPSTLAFKTGITTITDFRMADIAAGGQGAPLVPTFHQCVFQTPNVHRFILNIGGIANISYLPGNSTEAVIGFDTGPGNTLLDEWIYLHCHQTYDKNGEWSASGKVIPQLLASLMTDEYLQKPLPKSTGKEHFNLAWLSTHLKAIPFYIPEDVQRTLVEFTACSIAQGIKQTLSTTKFDNCEVFVCGGGIRNKTLMQALKQQLHHIPVSSTEDLGIPPQLVESAAFAWLARQTLSGKPGNLPSVTGASCKRILGGIYQS